MTPAMWIAALVLVLGGLLFLTAGRRRALNLALEEKVQKRTDQLVAANQRLESTITELRDTQTQLILSERLAGLGLLVAGVAHEVNSPSAAIGGTSERLSQTAVRLGQCAGELWSLGLSDIARSKFLELSQCIASRVAESPLPAPTKTRRWAREYAPLLEAQGVDNAEAESMASGLADLAVEADEFEVLAEIATDARAWGCLTAYLRECASLLRACATIAEANARIQGIVKGLKSYSHLDQPNEADVVDVHEGLDSTLALFEHLFQRGITLTRQYQRDVPLVSAYVDQLNQVWTNLVHNAVQALEGQGQLSVETHGVDGGVAVDVVDDGPGIGEDVLPHIFEPFFTTKARGEGSGLGLRIVRQIVDRHGGRVTVESTPGKTKFRVWLPGGMA